MKRKAFVIIGIVVTVAIAGIVFWSARDNKAVTSNQKQARTAPVPADDSQFNPKSDSEQAIRNSNTPTPSTTAPAAQSPAPTSAQPNTIKTVISGIDGASDPSAGEIELSAITDGATSGTCTALLTKGSAVVKGTGPIQLVTTYYACSVKIPKAQLSSGDWSASVSVSTPNSQGTSDAKTVAIAK